MGFWDIATSAIIKTGTDFFFGGDGKEKRPSYDPRAAAAAASQASARAFREATQAVRPQPVAPPGRAQGVFWPGLDTAISRLGSKRAFEQMLSAIHRDMIPATSISSNKVSGSSAVPYSKGKI